jgi:hypothetical protein
LRKSRLDRIQYCSVRQLYRIIVLPRVDRRSPRQQHLPLSDILRDAPAFGDELVAFVAILDI